MLKSKYLFAHILLIKKLCPSPKNLFVYLVDASEEFSLNDEVGWYSDAVISFFVWALHALNVHSIIYFFELEEWWGLDW